MELFKEILINLLQKEEMTITLPNFMFDAGEIIQMKCYDALLKIKTVIQDENINDDDCREKIEKIKQVFKNMGSDL